MDSAIYQVDAFADRRFAGNPAAVMPFDAWPGDELLQALAGENNLAETAFFVASPAEDADYDLRWFTPKAEVDLCGHATLASAHILFTELGFTGELVRFQTKSGILTVRREDDRLVMDFPARPPRPALYDEAVATALGIRPRLFVKARDLIAVYEDAADVAALRPDMRALTRSKHFAVVATAPGDGEFDFVSRFFAPAIGVDEDPVTGSAHAELFPYWGQMQKKTEMTARQISARGGTVWGKLIAGGRVEIAGEAVTFFRGRAEV
ncbi:PhzF family phenazine biosynthesis protein [Govanella unica]|uniref:PhzF family phenazine biosynthesis protein n=1 Tax=Govanella unica TaxID=2975056 RepID=A0A9X3U020_9PROT|nr:PhzF family phenazine biosynthesis protein [Govania unica]MDA5194484.1 PhzF family phenazine biosynthesis protein [Govania unica]